MEVLHPGKGKVYIYSNGKIDGINEKEHYNILENYKLLQNYPNPFNPTTTIRYDIPQASQVTIKIFDALGAESAVLLNEFKRPGRYTVEWNAKKFASGVYYYTIKAANFIQTKKMILLK